MRARPEDWLPVPSDDVLLIFELEGIRNRGLVAYRAGRPLEANPYARSLGEQGEQLRAEWAAGWRSGKFYAAPAKPVNYARLFLRDRYCEGG
jgi:hypothetical protein